MATTANTVELKKALAQAKTELQTNLAKKKQIDRNLATLEATLYAFETSYLAPANEATNSAPSFGNIVKGYDAYLKAPNAAGGHADRKRARLSGAHGPDVKEEDRLFSRSSDTYQRSLELKEREAASSSEDPGPEEIVAAATSSASGTGNKKRKKN